MAKHEYTTLDRARDELFSHIQRCEVLEAGKDEHMNEWLEETMEFMAERYPDLTDLQLAQLRMMGERYLEPVIPHGQTHNAINRDEEEEAEEEAQASPAVAEAPDELEAADEAAAEPPEAVTTAV